jgi:hypothetical protein
MWSDSACNVMALDEKQEGKFDPEEYQFLTKFEIKPSPNGKYRLHFFNNSEKRPKKINSERLNTDESNSVNLREEETYLIVRKLKDANGEPKGYLLGTSSITQNPARPSNSAASSSSSVRSVLTTTSLSLRARRNSTPINPS